MLKCFMRIALLTYVEGLVLTEEREKLIQELLQKSSVEDQQKHKLDVKRQE